ncbi:Chaperone protein dnaJ A8, chloroplastic [Nosema granulosis]|uniref:Chaperone protein dnaJ A8, chloroplastic n=1 Tax=Nosema granulosis TaxID=83296 RepID=A0A9P6H1K6_9MICR|nr:Chaperone protein dnaJ A8, chloroplastic [Nosema granulosis]
MHPPGKNLFELFCIKPHFHINKHDLKNKYFELARIHHPDISGDPTAFKKLTQAYSILSDDLKRAMYLNKHIVDTVDSDFLYQILEIEEQIDSEVNTKQINDLLSDLINNCKKNYKDVKYLSKWVYYERLLKKLKEKKADQEISKFM